MKLTPKQTQILKSFGYEIPLDFLRHYPYRYETLFQKPFSTWERGELVIFEADLVSGFKTFRFGKNQSKTSFQVVYDGTPLTVTLFNRPYLKMSHYENNMVITGTYNDNYQINARSITNKPLETQTGIIPIYPMKQGIKQYEIKRLMTKILKDAKIKDIVPEVYIKNYRLMHRRDALKSLHKPSSQEQIHQALRTLKYEEFLIFHLANALNSSDFEYGHIKKIDKDMLKSRIQALPFSLTVDQILVLEEINQDLSSTKQMHRLLQGDVGSGKTIVALLSAMSVIDNGYQVAFMVPTEILLEQHEKSLNCFFKDVRYEVISSSTPNKETIINRLKEGDLDLILGTHTLFQDSVTFKNLGLVIIDEQHRSGVSQRKALISKGDVVDVLMLSATPIPRSLASSIYFDLDVSTIQTYPEFKKENTTYVVKENSMRTIMDDLLKRLQSKDQMYVVCPSIDDAKAYGYRNVLDIYESLKEPFKDYRLGMIHGKMSSEDKEKIMTSFSNHEIDILISTTVIEVGIDIPNANTMVIYNAEMFGLSTLHQLRGRIGRGEKAGVCYVLTDKDQEETLERLTYFSETNDGFKLSMKDLRMRGMGDILGERQSGLPNFVLGDIEQDQNILNQAKQDAKTMLKDIDNADFRTIVKISSELKMVYN